MSSKNGEKARFHIKRKNRILRRKLTKALKEQLAQQTQQKAAQAEGNKEA